jgi:hypothetical protein
MAEPGAQPTETYVADYVGQTPMPRLLPGQLGCTYLRLRNLGTATWRRDGKHQVLLATDRPADRVSAFNVPDLWPLPNRPGRLVEAEVSPGAVGTFEIPLRAPWAPGRYVEPVRPVAELLTWFNDLEYAFVVDVAVPVAGRPPDLAYELLGQPPPLLLRPGERADLPIGVRNVGAVRWTDRGGHYGPLVQLGTVEPFDHPSRFHDPERWLGPPRCARVPGFVVPGQAIDLLVSVRAPTTRGTYEDRFQLVAETIGWLDGPQIAVRVSVV